MLRNSSKSIDPEPSCGSEKGGAGREHSSSQEREGKRGRTDATEKKYHGALAQKCTKCRMVGMVGTLSAVYFGPRRTPEYNRSISRGTSYPKLSKKNWSSKRTHWRRIQRADRGCDRSRQDRPRAPNCISGLRSPRTKREGRRSGCGRESRWCIVAVRVGERVGDRRRKRNVRKYGAGDDWPTSHHFRVDADFRGAQRVGALARSTHSHILSYKWRDVPCLSASLRHAYAPG